MKPGEHAHWICSAVQSTLWYRALRSEKWRSEIVFRKIPSRAVLRARTVRVLGCGRCWRQSVHCTILVRLITINKERERIAQHAGFSRRYPFTFGGEQCNGELYGHANYGNTRNLLQSTCSHPRQWAIFRVCF